MSKQITIRVPDETYSELEELCKESLRPLAAEVLFQMRQGMRSLMYKDLTPKKATPEEAMAFAKEALKEDEVRPMFKNSKLNEEIKWKKN